ncbi:hypothetical protein C6341_g13472 [Phytophthora cactorum]|nr:hypothetical protein C6341_g13472 [Phytophthora cactorum]
MVTHADKKTSLEDDGVDDSSKEITTYYSKHHNGADHVQRSGGALAATHGQSVVLAQLEAQFQGEDADEGDQVGECRVQAARAAARDGRKRAHLSRRGRLVCCCVERTREVADLVEPTKIVEAVRKVRLCMVTHADVLSVDCVNTLFRPDGTVAFAWIGLRSPPEL